MIFKTNIVVKEVETRFEVKDHSSMLRILVSQPTALLSFVLLYFDFRIDHYRFSGFVPPPPTYLSTNIRSFEPSPSRPLCLPTSIPNKVLILLDEKIVLQIEARHYAA